MLGFDYLTINVFEFLFIFSLLSAISNLLGVDSLLPINFISSLTINDWLGMLKLSIITCSNASLFSSLELDAFELSFDSSDYFLFGEALFELLFSSYLALNELSDEFSPLLLFLGTLSTFSSLV